MEEIRTAYKSVLGSEGEYQDAIKVYELMLLQDKPIHHNSIAKQTSVQPLFVRTVLSVLLSEKMAKNGTGAKAYYWELTTKGRQEKKVLSVLKDKYTEKIPKATSKHYDKYGFDNLVKSVAIQIDYQGRTVRRFREDALWVGRYIDFLAKAEEYLSWRESDNAIAKMMANKARKESKS